MNIVVIGAGYAGTLAALRLAGKSKNQNITLINASDTFVERIRLHELAAGKPPKRRSIPSLLRGKNINFVKARVTSVEPARREVALADHSPIAYDYLVYALGSSVDTSVVPGIREHALTLGSVETTERMQTTLRQNPVARIVICGGGLTGIELASEIAETYPTLAITLLSRDPLGTNLSHKGHAYAHEYFRRHNVVIREGVTISRVLPDGVLTEDEQHIPADLVLWAGSFGVPALAREAGLAVNRCGQILVDPYLRSVSHPEIFAVGDAAASGPRMSCNAAMPMGAHAADNLAALVRGEALKPFRFGFSGRCISLGRHNGMMQLVEADDMPKEQIITGRAGAIIKELICRYTTASLAWTRHYPNAYWWSQPQQVITQPTTAPAPQRA